MQVDFYHLTFMPVEQVLPRFAERVLGEGGRLLVVSQDEGLAQRLDTHLWSYRAESFLPHGRAGDEAEAAHPVLIAGDCAAPNSARNVALADGMWRDEALAFERVFLFFGESQIDAARSAWRGLAQKTDIERRYWKQDDAGRWSRVQ